MIIWCHSYLLLFVIAVSSWSLQVRDDLPRCPTIALPKKSISLSSSISSVQSGKAKSALDVEEVYSDWQKRSRVKYQEHDRGDANTFYADEQQVLLLEGHNQRCKLSTSEYAYQTFNLSTLKSVAYSPMVGPSRLLQFAAENQQIIQPIRTTPNDPKMYEYGFELPSQNASYSILYYKDDIRNLPHGIPSGAVIRSSKDDSIIIYRFFSFHVLPNEPIYGSAIGLMRPYRIDGGKPLIHEALSIAPAIGCGQVQYWARETRNSLMATKFRFSFKAQLGKVRMFIGYEPSMATLRVDRVGRTRVSKTMTNFNTRLMHHTIQWTNVNDSLLDELKLMRKISRLEDDIYCVVTRVPPEEDDSLRLGRMLFGSDKLTYLGLALVRGMEARAFEAFNSSWPLWLEQAFSYHTTKDWINVSRETKTRPPTGENGNVLLNTVIYLSNTLANEEPIKGRLLLIEVHRLHPLTLKKLKTTSIPVQDFTWSLSGDSPTGESPEQFFSLGDSCASANTEENHYGQVELLVQRDWTGQLEMGVQETSDWLSRSTRRNFALIQALQESFILPASMIYDIQTNYRKKKGASKTVVSVSATFRVIEHRRALVQLIYIGRGELKSGRQEGFKIAPVVSFQSCYFMAAHRQISAVFAFDTVNIECLIYQEGVIGTAKTTLDSNFDVSKPDGKMEIYRIRHMRAPSAEDELTQLFRSQDRLRVLSALTLTDPLDESAKLKMDLKSVEVVELDAKMPSPLGEQQLADSNKFNGFALMAADRQNREIFHSHYGHCHANCMADLGCQTYSVCIRDARVQCILSSVSFRSPLLISKMVQLGERKTKLGEQFNLTLDSGRGDEWIRVTRQAGCELYNKLYSDLFLAQTKNTKISVNLLERRLYPVSHREQCAMLCTKATMSVLAGDVETARRTSWSVLHSPQDHSESVGQMFDAYKRAHLNICSAFLYLDQRILLALRESTMSRLERQVVGKNESDIINGYCILGESPTDEERSTIAPNGQTSDDEDPSGRELRLSLEKYDFDFTFMFKRQHGVSLSASQLGPKEETAFKRLFGSLPGTSEPSEEAFRALKLAVEEGDNFVYSILGDERQCARACALQLLPIWPACRSFEVFEVKVRDVRELHCHFNSVSLRDSFKAERFDLIRNKPEEQTRMPKLLVASVTHYEPIANSVAESLELTSQLALGESYVVNVQLNGRHLISIGYFGLLATILIALVVGAAAGMTVGVRVFHRPLNKIPDDVDVLIEQPQIEFSNIVNYEGKILANEAEQRQQHDSGQGQ